MAKPVPSSSRRRSPRLRALVGRWFDRLESIHREWVYDGFRARYSLAPTVRFNGPDVLLYGEGGISIDEDTYVGRSSLIQAAGGSEVAIGRACRLASNVRILTRSAVADQDESTGVDKHAGDVRIGDYVWIAANVVVLPGVTIGDHAVVGANSVVTSDVGAATIVGGVPARLLRTKTRVGASESDDEPDDPT